MSIQINAKARLQAAPISKGEQERFAEALAKLDPFFANRESRAFDYTGNRSLVWEEKGAALKVINILTRHGWVSKPEGDGHGKEYVITKDGKWPMRMHTFEGTTFLALPQDDSTGSQMRSDPEYTAALTKMAKSLLPSGFRVMAGKAEWYKRGGHAGGDALATCAKKALAVGFKVDSGDQHGRPDGGTVGRTDIYRHPSGWVLSIRSSYGNTKADNSYSANLSFDAQRGL